MNWKEFLKPDWRKILLFIITFLISPQRVIFEYPSPIGFPTMGTKLVFPFGGLSIISEIISNIKFGVHPFTTIDISIMLLMLITSYILSCLIIELYDTKIKKEQIQKS